MDSSFNNALGIEINGNQEIFSDNANLDLTNSINIDLLNSQYNQIIPIMSPPLYEKNVNPFSKISFSYINNKESFLFKVINNNVNKEYKYYTFDEILEILKKNKKFSKIKNKFKKNQYIEKAEEKLCNKKRKRETFFEKYLKKNNNLIIFKEKKNDKIKKKRGRKCKEDSGKEVHTKMSSDNIIKKIKCKIMDYLVIFMNNILDRKISDLKLYKIDYKYKDQINKKIDLDLLEKSLKDLLSMNITSKVKRHDKNFNEVLIEQILEQIKKEKSMEYINTIIFVLNMKFRDWISLFTFKKNIYDLIKENDDKNINSKKIHNNLVSSSINCDKIEKSLIGADVLLNQILLKNDSQYLSSFIFHLYNYERWFYIIFGRNKKEKNNDIKE